MKTILKDAESKMQKALDRLDYEYSTIRAGRANPAVLEKVSVDYYGAMTPINQMAAVSVAEARILVIQPWDVSTLKAIEKAIFSKIFGLLTIFLTSLANPNEVRKRNPYPFFVKNL